MLWEIHQKKGFWQHTHDSVLPRKAEAQEKDGGKCEFDKSLEALSHILA